MARARTRSREELFPADRGLHARIVVAAVLTPVIVVGLPVWYAIGDWTRTAAVLLAVACGAFQVVREIRARPAEDLLRDGEEPKLQAMVARLCVVADLPRPGIVLHEEAQPNSWIVDPPRRPARLHVTRGLLDLLDPAELEAVIAHELAHVANRDATVMTVVALPVEAMSRGGHLRNGGWLPWLIGTVVVRGVGFVAGFGSTALSRYRELTADAGAAAMTGRPMALASALRKVSDTLAVAPVEDLRVAAGSDALRLVGSDEPLGMWRLHGRSHPSVERRIAALERMEHALVHGRRAA